MEEFILVFVEMSKRTLTWVYFRKNTTNKCAGGGEGLLLNPDNRIRLMEYTSITNQVKYKN